MTPLTGSASRLCPRHAGHLAEACARTLDDMQPTTSVSAWSSLTAELADLRATCTRLCSSTTYDTTDDAPLALHHPRKAVPA